MSFLGLCQVTTCKASDPDGCKSPGNDACYKKLQPYVDPPSGTFHDKPVKTQVRLVYETHVETGQRYKDADTGFEGVAVSVHFYQHGDCPRATLRTLIDHRVVDHTFDAPGLVRVCQRPATGFQSDGQ